MLATPAGLVISCAWVTWSPSHLATFDSYNGVYREVYQGGPYRYHRLSLSWPNVCRVVCQIRLEIMYFIAAKQVVQAISLLSNTLACIGTTYRM